MLSEQKMKNLVNNRAKEYGLKPQEVYGLFGLEQLLIKISQSHYKDYFILKGGYLLSVVHGLNNRATRDLNSTIRQMPLTQKSMEQFAMFLESPEANGAIHFKVMRINAIRDRFEYEGFNLKLQFMNGRTMFPINIDLTTGEELLPVVDAQEIPLLFGEGHIEMPAYPIEQIMADKLYTTLAYGVIDDKNTRAKDLYDIHFFSKFYRDMDLEKVHHAPARRLVANKHCYRAGKKAAKCFDYDRTLFRCTELFRKISHTEKILGKLQRAQCLCGRHSL